MRNFLRLSFGGLSRAYYFRHLFFATLLLGLLLYYSPDKAQDTAFISLAIAQTLLYPYARFVYESVATFILGNSTFLVGFLPAMFFKTFTMLVCWALSPVIAPSA